MVRKPNGSLSLESVQSKTKVSLRLQCRCKRGPFTLKSWDIEWHSTSVLDQCHRQGFSHETCGILVASWLIQWMEVSFLSAQCVFCSSAVLDSRVGHHGRTFSIYPCPLSFWLSLPRRVLSTSWCCMYVPVIACVATVAVCWWCA